jgi:hypothetical protein
MGGPVNNTSGYSSYSNNFFYTDGYGMPTGNFDFNGNKTIQINGIGIDYAAGGSGMRGEMVYQGVHFGAGPVNFSASGGTAQLRLAWNSGTTYFGRNTGNGLVTRDAADGQVYGGGLCGFIYWGTAPTQVPSTSAVMVSPTSIRVDFAGPASDGGFNMAAFYIHGRRNGGAWSHLASVGNSGWVHGGLTPGDRWDYRVLAVNTFTAALPGPVSNAITLPSPAGSRYTGSAFVRTTQQRRRTATGWVDITQARRFNGTAWVNLT